MEILMLWGGAKSILVRSLQVSDYIEQLVKGTDILPIPDWLVLKKR